MIQVQWLPWAMAELTAIWAQLGPAWQAILQWAIGDLDYRLARDPQNEGESRPFNTRITFSWPLGVLFTVDDATRTVRIHHVWYYF